MLRKEAVSDKAISQKINQRLARAGLGSGSRMTVTVHNGQVTLSGSIQYETQRRPALRAIDGIDGVRGIADQMQVRSGGSHRK